MECGWTLTSVELPLGHVAQMCDASEHYVWRKLDSGIVGPAPWRVANVQASLFHVSGLLMLRELEKRGVRDESAKEVLPHLAASAFIRLALTKLHQGRWEARGGTPAEQAKLWMSLRSDEGPRMLQSHLPVRSAEPRRYGLFNETAALACDDINDIKDGDWPVTIDSWATAARIRSELPASLFMSVLPGQTWKH
jgi:hypothetical protein